MNGQAATRTAALNQGRAETRTLGECLAVNFATLMQAVAPELPQDRLAQMSAASGKGITHRMHLAATLTADHPAHRGFDRHLSDTVRGWACYLIAQKPGADLTQRLHAIRPLADDPHFGVREWAWLSLRPALSADPNLSIALLVPWTSDPSDRVRRFASEAMRPRGVWAAHIQSLRRDPSAGFCLLEPLRADPSRYVQNSVGNWLNDAAKDQPDMVRALCDRWRKESPGAATEYICNRALRSLGRKAATKEKT